MLVDLSVDVIKIDTQGVDHDVIAGLTGMFGRSTSTTIVCEFWPDGMQSRGVDPLGVAQGYRQLGFDLAVLGGEGRFGRPRRRKSSPPPTPTTRGT